MNRSILYAALVVASVVVSAASGVIRRDISHTNDFIILFPLEVLAVLLGGAATARYLAGARDRAPGALGVGVYLLLVGAVMSSVFPGWLPTDDTILGSALLAGVLAGVGGGLALASAVTLRGGSSASVSTAGFGSAVLVFLLVTAGGVVAPLFQARVPLLAVGAALVCALALAWRERPVQPILLAIVGAVATTIVLLARGPDDWSSASTSLKLYSFPIVVMALGVSLLLLQAPLRTVAANGTRRTASR